MIHLTEFFKRAFTHQSFFKYNICFFPFISDSINFGHFNSWKHFLTRMRILSSTLCYTVCKLMVIRVQSTNLNAMSYVFLCHDIRKVYTHNFNADTNTIKYQNRYLVWSYTSWCKDSTILSGTLWERQILFCRYIEKFG